MTQLNRVPAAAKRYFFALIMLAIINTPGVSAATHQKYAYAEGKTYVINTALGIATQIIVDRDEKILDYGTGFSAGWELVRRDNIFYVKPIDADAETNMYIRTDKRSYILDLQIVSKGWKKIDEAKLAGVHYVIQFTYPATVDVPSSSVFNKFPPATGTTQAGRTDFLPSGRTSDIDASPSALSVNKIQVGLTGENVEESEISPTKISYEPTGRKTYFTNYEVTSSLESKWLVPVRIYDDGAFTYLKFADGVQSPAIFARASLNTEEYVVNKTVRGENLQIIHGLHPILVVRYNGAAVGIRRKIN